MTLFFFLILVLVFNVLFLFVWVLGMVSYSVGGSFLVANGDWFAKLFLVIVLSPFQE